jgi:gamma-glutamyltranspeptidase/glutathione hydrolase
MVFQSFFQSRQFLRASVLLTGLALGACGGGGRDKVSIVEDFSGLVAADEPRAAIVGKELLQGGASAVDAGVAMYFTMAATLPSRAGLGGGGACVVFTSNAADDDIDPEAETFVFPAGGYVGGAPMPMNARAMGVIHARHGTLRWEQLVTHGENLARFGHPISRAFAKDIHDGRGIIARDPDLTAILVNEAGEFAMEGDIVVQEKLSTALAGIRSKGAVYLHLGPYAERLVEAYGELGYNVAKDAFSRNLPAMVAPIEISIGSDTAYFAPPPADGGVVSAQLWQLLDEVESYDRLGDEDRAHLFAEASLLAFAERTPWLSEDGPNEDDLAELVDEDHLEEAFDRYRRESHLPAESYEPGPIKVASDPFAAGFIAADRWGNAIACSFSMNGLFGSGRQVPGTGITAAASYVPGATNLTPVIVGNESTGDVRFAASVSGGVAAPAALLRSMLLVYDADGGLKEALAAPRITNVGAPDITWVEPNVPEEVRLSLSARGHDVREAPEIGEVVALFCADGILDGHETCEVHADRRGHGLAFFVQ